jgi:nitronate monooxygenase
LRNSAARKVLEIERRGGQIEDIAPYVAGPRGLRMLENGDMDSGVLSTGQVTGLIRDIPSVADLINRIMSQAQSIIAERLTSCASMVYDEER